MLVSALKPAVNHPLKPNATAEEHPPRVPDAPRQPVRKLKRWDFPGFFSFPDFDMLQMMHSRKGVAELLTPQKPVPLITGWQRLKQALWSCWGFKPASHTEDIELRPLRTQPAQPLKPYQRFYRVALQLRHLLNL